MYQKADDPREAERLLLEAVTLEPDGDSGAISHLYLGHLYESQGYGQKARASYLAAQRLGRSFGEDFKISLAARLSWLESAEPPERK